MKLISILLVFFLAFSSGTILCSASEDDTEMLGDAVLGGLLGAGVGAAIGSASGEAGKGAAIGAGAGALGNILLGTMRRSSYRDRHYPEDGYYERGYYRPYRKSGRKYSYDDGYYKPGVTRKIIREYDKNGNIISEKEVYYDGEGAERH